MESRKITPELIEMFYRELIRWERSVHTIERYLFDVRAFAAFLDGREVCAELTKEFKDHLIARGYAATSINTMLASIFSFLGFMGWKGCRTQWENIQNDSYISENAELSRQEYRGLLAAAKSDRDRLVMETLCATGIRVSELQYFTLEGVSARQLVVKCKRKIRRIMIPDDLGRSLEDYAGRNGITSGVIFLGRTGMPLGRRRVWSIMKEAGRRAGVISEKVYPHSLRKLFARTFLDAGGTLSQLCDVLGHSSIETTRLYIKTSGAAHRELVERMGLATPLKRAGNADETSAKNAAGRRVVKNQKSGERQGFIEERDRDESQKFSESQRFGKKQKLSRKQRAAKKKRRIEKQKAAERQRFIEKQTAAERQRFIEKQTSADEQRFGEAQRCPEKQKFNERRGTFEMRRQAEKPKFQRRT